MSRISSTYKFATACLVITVLSFAPQSASAQKFAYIDSDYVLLRACKPYKMTNTEYEKRTIAAGFFDDQTCLNRFLMESAGQRNSRVKVDMDGSLMLSLGGTDPNTFKTAKDGRVFWEKTQKAPCVWHFNNPDSKKRMPAVAKKFPGYWV